MVKIKNSESTFLVRKWRKICVHILPLEGEFGTTTSQYVWNYQIPLIDIYTRENSNAYA